ncbi:MAG: hypothetical protein QOH31_690 [Verrucomicrobiota bacterium]|jgi:hypothetical protein
MGRAAFAYAARIEFEELRRYPFCVATSPAHPFPRLKSVFVEEVSGNPALRARALEVLGRQVTE